ncbi:Ankyrin-3 [Dactylellina cionopaga]|nr:Ankyrin-3 [Dactylellina cionopaga]
MADPLSVAASLIAVIQLSNKVLSYCYRFHMQAKDSHKEIFPVISELEDLRMLLDQIQEVLPAPDPKVATDGSNQVELAELPGLRKSLTSSGEVLGDISDRLAPMLGKGLLARLKWPFEGKAIQEKLDNLHRQKTTFQLFLSIHQAKLLGEQTQALVDQGAILGEVRNQSDKARRTSILNWYKTSDPEQNHKVSRTHHEPDTCNWIFQTEDFQSWSTSPGEHLWVHGIPGAGKTIICSTIIEHMRTICDNDPDTRLVYYYFDFADGKKQTLTGFLQSAIYQLLVTSPGDLPEAAAKLYDKYNGLQEPGVEELSEVFIDLISNYKAYVIVDAIDECSRQERTSFFHTFVSQLGSKSSILMTSRREPDIEKAIDPVFRHKLSIEDSKVDADVRVHVTNVMAKDPAFQNWTSATMRKEVLDAVVKGARGMFRWAICQLDAMKHCYTPRMVRAELGRMPETLDQTYDRILQTVPTMHQPFVQSALRWLAFSNRPLLLSELGEAAVIDPSFGSFDPEESRFLDPGKVLELCGSLVTLTSKTYDRELSGTNNWLSRKLQNESSGGIVRFDKARGPYTTVTLSHYSVKEYLTSDRLNQSALAGYFTTAKIAHGFISECSLLYLLDLGKGEILSARAYDEYPLLEYCAVNWMEHYKNGAEDTLDSSVTKLLLRFFSESETAAYVNWLNSYDPDNDVPGNRAGQNYRNPGLKSASELEKPLYWAAQLGYISIVESITADSEEVSGSGRGYFGSPLAAAAFLGHEGVVESLLQSGADPNGKGGNFGNVLQAAAAGGSRKIVEKLVKAGADIGKVGGAWNTALIAAATYKHDDVVSFLLKSQADLNISSTSHGSAFYQAALAGDIKTVTRLLASGADVNEMGSDGTPLYAAALSGSLQIVQLLLRRGADVNKGGVGQWDYPLTAAASEGKVDVVRVLLRAGANVNAQRESPGGRGVSALEAAIESRNLQNFQMILDAGGDPNIKGNLYPNGLYAALWTGELAMAKILLNKNADVVDQTFMESIERWGQDPWFFKTILDKSPNVDAHLGNSGSALHCAIHRAGEEVVQLLLAKDPYIDAISELGTVVTCAISRGMVDIVKELIRRGADVKREVEKYEYSFTASIYRQIDSTAPNFEIPDLLLGMGVDINGGGRRAISGAINTKNVPILQYLARNGADFNSILPFDECTPLQIAIREKDLAIVKLLVDLGAEINGIPGENGTVLHYAMRTGDEAIVRYFLGEGAIVDDSVADSSLICSALTRGLVGLIPELVKLGADVNKVDRMGWTPLALAIKEGNEEMEKLLREHGARANETKAETFLAVITQGNIDCITKLLEEGVDPNQCNSYQSPINVAVKARRKDIVELLVQYGVEIGALPNIHPNPLGIATETNNTEMLEYLLGIGADPNESRSGHCWALSQAARRGDIGTLDLLLDNGADVLGHEGYVFRVAVFGGEKALMHLLDKVPSTDRETALDQALQSAAYYAKLDLCELLVDMGADVNFVGGQYGSPLHAVVSNGTGYEATEINNRKAIFNLFLKRGAKPSEVDGKPGILLTAIRGRMVSYATELLKVGADPNATGDVDDCHSPLQAAALCAPSLLEPLIEAGADVNAEGGRFGTAIHVAAYSHDCQRIAILLKHGARLDLMSPKYGGVIQAAAKRDTISNGGWVAGEASVRAMQLLFNRGASVNLGGGRYGNAVQLAAKCDNLEGLKWLLSHGGNPHAKGRWGTPLEAALVKKKWRMVSYLEQHYGKSV